MTSTTSSTSRCYHRALDLTKDTTSSYSDNRNKLRYSDTEEVDDAPSNPNHDTATAALPTYSSSSSSSLYGSTTTLRNRQTAITIFSICTVLLFADQNLMSPNLTAMANDFGFDQDERDRKLGGDISLAFFLLGAPASFLVGCWADQSDRSALFAVTVGIGESACVATYWAHTYPQLYICRAITGFSLGGALPLIYSILGDLYPAEDRHWVSAAVSFGMGAGISVGQGVAGYLGPTFGWRLPFLIIGIPALLCALAVFLLVDDPERGAMEQVVLAQQQQQQRGTTQKQQRNASNDARRGQHDNNNSDNEDGVRSRSFLPSPTSSTSLRPLVSPPSLTRIDLSGGDKEQLLDTCMEDLGLWGDQYYGSSWFWQTYLRHHVQTMIRLLSTPSVLLAISQGAPGCIPWGIVSAFLTDFLSQDRGFSVEAATSILMCFSVGHVFGMLVLGGGGGKYLYQIDNRYPALLAGVTAILGCLPFWMLLNYVDPDTPYWKIATIAVAMGVATGPTGPIVKTTMTNVTLPRARGQAFALQTLFDDFGKGLGPFFVSIFISRMGGRLPAFNVGVLGWAVCGVLNLAIFCTVQKDEAAVQATLATELFGFPSSSSLKDTSALISRHEEEDGEEEENYRVDLELSYTHLNQAHPS